MKRFVAVMMTLIMVALCVESVPTQAAQSSSPPVHLRVLGEAPLLRGIHSTADLQNAVRVHDQLFRQASRLIGLSSAETHQLGLAIADGNVRWVTLPRHLERMTWASGSQAHVIYNVIIPANTSGWEVDIRQAHAIAHVYIPQVCGNVSITHSRLPKPAVKKPAPIVTPTPIPTATPTPVAVVQPPPQTIIVQSRRNGLAVPLALLGIAVAIFSHNTTNTTTVINNILPTPPPCF